MSSKKVPPPPPMGPPPPPQISGLDGFGEELSGIPSEGQLRYGSDAVADYAKSLDQAMPQLDDLSLEDLSDAPDEQEGGAQMHPVQAAALAEAQAVAAHQKAERERAKAEAAGSAPVTDAAPEPTSVPEAAPPPATPVTAAPPTARPPVARPEAAGPLGAPLPSAFLPPDMDAEAPALELEQIDEPEPLPPERASLEPVGGLPTPDGPDVEDAEPEAKSTPASMANAAVAELARQLEKAEGLLKPKTESRAGATGAQAVVTLPGQSSTEMPQMQLQRIGGPSPAPVPQKTGLFSPDVLVNGLVAGAIGLLLGLYPGHEASSRAERDQVDPLLTELEESINAPLEVRAGKLREPKAIARQIEEAQGAVSSRYYTFWLGSAVPLGLLLAFVRRRPRS